jgi:hypothetical protein
MSRDEYIREMTDMAADAQYRVASVSQNREVHPQNGYDIDLCGTCCCGAKLECFSEDVRTSISAEKRRRNHFGQLLEMLVDQGMDVNDARKELLKLINGEVSERLLEFTGYRQ